MTARFTLPRARPSLAAALACGALIGTLSGCGGNDSASSSSSGSIAPSAKAPAKVLGAVYGTRMTPQEAAAEASLKPTASGIRSEDPPLDPKVFDKPIAQYRAYATREAIAMRRPVAALIAALQHGDRDAAKQAWGDAYDRYLLLGAAYGALGDLDVAIDGTPGHLAGGVSDPGFTGIHRIEHDLWTGKPLPGIVTFAKGLQRNVDKLPHALRTVEITPLDYATRAHEIMEDAQRDMISNVAAPWSGEGLRATDDGLLATGVVLRTLSPILDGRGDALAQTTSYSQQLAMLIAQLKRAHGGQIPTLDQLTHTEHDEVNASLGALLEALSGIPGSLETQLAPGIPSIASQARAAGKASDTSAP
ncbi:MAG TPA: EfeM/EfeO family lipoprotein [Conexibacter sp.]|jgi:high-affinity iron transporter